MNIKICPHCGGSAYIYSKYYSKGHLFLVFVQCDICGAQGKVYTSRTDPSESDWDSDVCNDAINAWNMRYNERTEEE